MSRPLPLALTQHRRRDRAVPIPVSLAEQDTCRALERCGVDPDLIVRVVLPMARAARGPGREGAALIRYLLEKSTGGS